MVAQTGRYSNQLDRVKMLSAARPQKSKQRRYKARFDRLSQVLGLFLTASGSQRLGATR